MIKMAGVIDEKLQHSVWIKNIHKIIEQGFRKWMHSFLTIFVVLVEIMLKSSNRAN